MTPEEYQIIRDVFARIRSSGPIPNDPQARAAISQELIANPDAGIGLIQMLVGLEQQRGQLAQERDQLAAQLNALRGGAAPAGGSLFGRAAPAYTAPPPPPQPAQYAPGPWGQQAPPPPQPAQYAAPQAAAPQSSFLKTALGSAAGMAGGLFAFEAIRDVFGGHGGMFGGSGGYGGGFGGGTEYITENVYVDDSAGGGGGSYDSAGFDSSSDDSSFGGGGDDSSFA